MKPFAIRDALVVGAEENLKDLLVTVLKPGIWAIRYLPMPSCVAEHRRRHIQLRPSEAGRSFIMH